MKIEGCMYRMEYEECKARYRSADSIRGLITAAVLKAGKENAVKYRSANQDSGDLIGIQKNLFYWRGAEG